MNRAEFFKEALKEGRLGEKDWLLGAFSVLKGREDAFSDMKPFDILYRWDNESESTQIIFIDGDGNMIELDDFEWDPTNPKPPYRFEEAITLVKGDIANLTKNEVTVSYGNVVANWLLCVYPFGDKIGFFEGKFTIKDVEKIIEKRLVSDPEPDEEVDEGNITVSEYERYKRSAGILDGLTQLAVPSATKKSMTHSPKVEEKRKELLEKYKDRLHDPAVIAEIEKQLIALDREWLEGDDSMGFYMKDKSINVVRKKAHLMGGREVPFGDEENAQLIERSLSQGWDPEDIPAMINSLREGSYDRGKSTEMGGEAVKFILRIMQNTVITEEDCGSQLGIGITITEKTKEQYVGNWLIEGGELVQITDDNVNQFVGQQKIMRTPLYCRTERDNYCKTCIGARYADHEKGLPSAASGVASKFMNIFMQSVHGKELKTVPFDINSALS